MSLKLYTYSPEEFVDCGIFGEHPIEFRYSVSIDYLGGKQRRSVSIWQATVKYSHKDVKADWDWLPKLKESRYLQTKWEDACWEDYQRAGGFCDDERAEETA